MKIILVATDAKGKNVVFVSDTFNVCSLEEAVRLVKAGKFENVYVVQKGSGIYLRSSRNVPKKKQLEQLSVSSRQLFNFANDIRHAVSTPAVAYYLELYEHTLQKDGGPFIVIEGKAKITKEAAKNRLVPHTKYVFDAANEFGVDPYLLGAILIDEITRFGPFENITDPLAGYVVGLDTSGGIAQVTTKTARGLIKDGYYNPDPDDKKLSPQNISKAPLYHIYTYVREPRHSIFFAAAKMRSVIDEWKKFVDVSSKPDIIATLYSLYKDPHAHPQPSERGTQIATEFYQLAKAWLVPL